jgi:hypothetical protein
MSVSPILTFVSTVAFAIQFLIFVDRDSSDRVPFFPSLRWTWGADTLSKGLSAVSSGTWDGDTHRVGMGLGVVQIAAGPVFWPAPRRLSGVCGQRNLRHLFELFYSRKPNGLGLGLTIAQRIARAHGGRHGR